MLFGGEGPSWNDLRGGRVSQAQAPHEESSDTAERERIALRRRFEDHGPYRPEAEAVAETPSPT